MSWGGATDSLCLDHTQKSRRGTRFVRERPVQMRITLDLREVVLRPGSVSLVSFMSECDTEDIIDRRGLHSETSRKRRGPQPGAECKIPRIIG